MKIIHISIIKAIEKNVHLMRDGHLSEKCKDAGQCQSWEITQISSLSCTGKSFTLGRDLQRS
jgi:hypothetical protein